MKAGDRLGRYHLITELGRGGMGVVWDAVLEGPHGFRKPVALKVLRESRLNEELVSEARLGAMLSHPNIVGTFELGVSEGIWFMSMERVNGPTLRTLLKQGALPLPAVIDIGIQVATGLAYLHERRLDGHARGVIHRDIKPANLMLDPTGLVKICDLGIARLTERPGHPSGTAGYMPPEQYAGRAVEASDLFARGVTRVTVATRKRLFGKGEKVRQRTENVGTLLRSRHFTDAIVGAELVEPVLRRCLAPAPQNRFANAAELARELTLLRASLPGVGITALMGSASQSIEGHSTLSGAATRSPDPPPLSIGRKSLIRRTKARLSKGSVALVGPPGVGKTHLALSIVDRATPIAWVSVHGCRTEKALVQAISEGVGLHTPSSLGELATLLRLRGITLLVLDGLESDEGLGDVVVEVKTLITSRRHRQIPGLDQVEVPPMDAADAASLYRRAATDDPSDEVVDELVSSLDALPLALLLAAARTRRLSSEEVLTGTQDRFRLLRDRSMEGRHQALDFALEESVELLDPEVERALIDLSVFEGPFDSRAAEAVLASRIGALDLLDELVRESLVSTTDQRFVLLRSVRDFARERVRRDAASPERHAMWFASLGSPAALDALNRPGAAERFDDLVRQLPDVRAAFAWAVENEREEAAELALALLAVLRRRGPMEEGLEVVDKALSGPLSLEGLALLLEGAAECAGLLGQLDRALELCETGLGAAAHLPVELHAALLLRKALIQKRAELPMDALDEAIRIGSEGADLKLRARLANTRWLRTEAREDLLEAIAFAEAAAAEFYVARLTGNLGHCQRQDGDLQLAERTLRRALTLGRALGDDVGRVRALLSLGMMLAQQGDDEGSVSMYMQAERVCRRRGLNLLLDNAIMGRAEVAARRQDWVEFERLNLKALDVGGTPSATRIIQSNLAESCYHQGRFDEAKTWIALALQGGQGQSRAAALSVAAVLDAAAGLESGREHLAACLAIELGADDRIWQLAAAIRVGRLFEESVEVYQQEAARLLSEHDRGEHTGSAQIIHEALTQPLPRNHR